MAWWLLKTEPDVYGIDHLAAEKNQTARWDGIRNYQARNLIRDQVANGDLVFIYHSSCKVPGIAGTAKVVSAPYPDPSQFNPDSPYYDPESTADNPRWLAFDVQLAEKFDTFLPGKTLKQQPDLQGMVLFRQGRLSVQPVSEKEWQLIHSLLQFSRT
jgi:predicted RNA-binding protein with PUA-like domain